MSGKPNIIIITTHDSGCHFGCYGAQGVRTPNIDSLADSGVMFTNMFSPSPMCTPSRGALMTGMWPERNGLYGLSGSKWRYELSNLETHLSYVARHNGYKTALYGHQHEAIDDSDLGFDTIFPMTSGEHQRTAVEVCEGAADYVRKAAEARSLSDDKPSTPRPFYLQIGFHETHTPYIWGGNAPDDTYGTWTPEYTGYDDDDEALNAHIAEFQSSIHRVDAAVGKILDVLEETGLSNDTILLFNTDHGPELPRAKWTLFDRGCLVAFIMRWPAGGIRGGKPIDAFLGNLDFLPTLAELVGLDINHEMDGVSFAPVLDGSSDPVRDEMFQSFAYGSNVGVRTAKYKYMRNFGGTTYNAERLHEGMAAPIVALFDLEEDPYELHNIAEHPVNERVVKKLDDTLWRYLDSVESPLLNGHVYHPPARDLYDEYRAHRGEWASLDNPSFILEAKGRERYSGILDDLRIEVDFRGGTRTQVLTCYDMSTDPKCEIDLVDDPEYADRLSTLLACFWGRLEKNDDDVLSGIQPSEAHAKCLAEYEAWKAKQ